MGCFLQSDPLGFAAGDTNLYAYTWNDPANWSDPSGLAVEEFGRLMMWGNGAVAQVGEPTLCVANRIATALQSIGEILEDGGDMSRMQKIDAGINSCVTAFIAPRIPLCGCGGKGSRRGRGRNSFPVGTEVLTPEGPVAIETLREGDLVVARNEDTGVSGVFPVTGLMAHQASEVLWLTLENEAGEVTRMGVTAAHPLFITGIGWGDAGELAAGDMIRDKDLLPLTVLAVEVDTAPQQVYNLEIADAHTYFAGELEAWGHNARSSTSGNNSASVSGRAKHCQLGGFLGSDWRTDIYLGKGGRPDAVNIKKRTVIELKPKCGRSRDYKQLARYVRALEARYGGKWTGLIMRYKR